MKRVRRLIAGALAGTAAALLMVAPASAATLQTEIEVEAVTGSIVTAVGILLGGLIFGVLYLFKRQVGGFPENPDWVAPITIMRSKELPDEGDYGEQVEGHGGHGAHH